MACQMLTPTSLYSLLEVFSAVGSAWTGGGSPGTTRSRIRWRVWSRVRDSRSARSSAGSGGRPATRRSSTCRRRIEEAKQWLEATDEPIDSIAEKVGYEDPAWFRKLFKRRTGTTPARYRQRFQAIGRLGHG